jgi:hypothetical protein
MFPHYFLLVSNNTYTYGTDLLLHALLHFV